MKVLLTGKSGQVGGELLRSLAPLGEVIAPGRDELDLSRPDSIERSLRAHYPQVIVNAAAYTAVDRAEAERELAFAVNAQGPGLLARGASRIGALLVHYSTDYVFDGAKRGPYVEDDPTHPLSAYGESKVAGEQAITASGCRHLIFRTSWVYAARGRNFLLTILRLARERDELRVVDDQFGAPTTGRMLASATAEILARPQRLTAAASGVYHMSARGETSWCRFARAILDARGLSTRLVAIPTSEYPTPARRPAHSVLSNAKLERTFAVQLPDWREGLAQTLAEIP